MRPSIKSRVVKIGLPAVVALALAVGAWYAWSHDAFKSSPRDETAAVVMVEQIVRRLANVSDRALAVGSDKNGRRSEPATSALRLTTIRDAANEVGRPILFAGVVVIIVFLPILSLQGIEGKMFRPMAFSFMSALAGALVLSITIIPVMASLFLARTIQDKDTWLVRLCKRVYAPVLRLSIKHPVVVTTIALAAFTTSVVIASQFGAEFIPKLDEGDVAMEGVRLQSVSLDTSIRLSTDIEQTLMDDFPDEVQSVITKIGRPEIATDPMGVNRSDIFVMLKPPESWTKFQDKESLVTAMEDTLAEKIPGQSFGFSQPIELRVQELIAGVRADVGISVYGPDLEVLSSLADEVVRAVEKVDGAADVRAEQLGGMS